MYICVYMCIHICMYLCVISTRLSLPPPIRMFICSSACLFDMCIYLPSYLSIDLSIYIYLSIYISLHQYQDKEICKMEYGQRVPYHV